MNTAIQVFTHSVRQVFGNLADAVRLSALPYGLQVATSLLLVGMIVTSAPGSDAMMEAKGVVPLLLFGLVAVVTSLMIAVNWHRFVLNNERPGLFPHMHGREMLAYLGRAVMIGLVVFAVMIPLILLLGMGLGGGMLARIVFLVVALAASLAVFRLSVSLPAMAVGERISLREGWNSLAGQWPMLLGVGFCCVIGQLGLGLLVLMFSFSAPTQVVVQLLVNWIMLMVGLSILTTLYGHYVQGRPLH